MSLQLRGHLVSGRDGQPVRDLAGREPDQPGAVLQAGDPPPHAAAQAARHEESQCK